MLFHGQVQAVWDQARFKALLSQNFDDVADELAESGIDFSF